MSKKSSESPRPILVATDFSPHSVNALIWAANAAECAKAPVLLLHVVHDPESSPGYYLNAKKRKKLLKRFEEAADEMMSEFVQETLKEHPILKKIKDLETILVIGLPVTRILEIAKNRNAQLIVVGSQGRTGLPHLLLGSKALKVAQLSPIPVTIVKDRARDGAKEASSSAQEANP
jgi:nucleotide-binding universal stress UspA family protein